MSSPPAEVVLFADAVFTPVERLADGWVHVRGGAHRGRRVGPRAGHRRAGGALAGRDDARARVHRPPRPRRRRRAGRARTRTRSPRSPRSTPATARPGCSRRPCPGRRTTLLDTVRAVSAVARRPGPEAARVLGCHLEGPFLSPERPGALDVRHLRPPDRDELEPPARRGRRQRADGRRRPGAARRARAGRRGGRRGRGRLHRPHRRHLRRGDGGLPPRRASRDPSVQRDAPAPSPRAGTGGRGPVRAARHGRDHRRRHPRPPGDPAPGPRGEGPGRASRSSPTRCRPRAWPTASTASATRP